MRLVPEAGLGGSDAAAVDAPAVGEPAGVDVARQAHCQAVICLGTYGKKGSTYVKINFGT